MKPRIISRTVWILSMVSLFTDMASEMLYPVMPIYLKSIGFSVITIGVLEGIAEAAAGLSKGYFGKMSDNLGRRMPFVRVGYALSSLSKPLLALATFPLWIFTARTMDRLGKGVRTGAKDALLSDEATLQTKARVFGFHRGMDTLGAVLGPLLALVYLHFYPESYRQLFLLAALPGIAAVAFTFLLRDKEPKPRPAKTGLVDLFSYWKSAPPAYRRLLKGLLAFALVNSSDVFLLLKIREAGLSATAAIGLYMFYNLVFALASYPAGMLADRIGLRPTFTAGLMLFAGVYFGMASASSLTTYFGLFFLYGIFAAATDGVAKAWITNITESGDSGAAIGTYTGFQSVCTMVASAATGLLWHQFGPATALLASATGALLIVGYFLSGRVKGVAG